MANVVDLTEDSFENETAHGVVLIDFWAPWCGPCRLQHPVVEQVAQKLGDRAKVARVNVDENGALANRFSIQSIPTLVVLKDGEEHNRLVGLKDEKTLTEAVQKALGA